MGARSSYRNKNQNHGGLSVLQLQKRAAFKTWKYNKLFNTVIIVFSFLLALVSICIVVEDSEVANSIEHGDMTQLATSYSDHGTLSQHIQS